ncbi:MAG: non-homologous end-joining DNA ligase [Candidatus Babeliales bacterium]
MKKYAPMLAEIGSQDDLARKDLIFEPKLDGYRVIVHVGKTFELISRNGNDMTMQFPELESVQDAIKADSCVLDGELVCYDKEGNPSFDLIQGRSQLGSRMIIHIRAAESPATIVLFDVLEYNGKSMLDTPLIERKKLLDKIILKSDRMVTVPYTTDGKKMWKEITKRDTEGVIAKEAKSHYYPGKRKDVWLKIKHYETADCVVIGYTQERRLISSLSLGMYDKKGELVSVGSVGTGFTEAVQKELYKKLYPLHGKITLDGRAKIAGIKWVNPVLVVEVKFLEFTKDKKLRHVSFLRIRTDKKADECVFPSK